MKKLIILLNLFCILCTIPAVSGIAVHAEESEEEYILSENETLEYRKYDTYIEICGHADLSGAFQIPAEIDGLPVRSIDDYAFADCEALTSINIPEGVTSIGSCAFLSCSGLEMISVPETVNFIGYGAFDGTPWKESQMQGDFLIINQILTDASSCSGDVILPDSIISIGEFAFSNCTELTSVTIPESVTAIGEGAFSYCTSLTSMTIPENVKTIGASAFGDCTSLKTVECSASQIGAYSFCFCTSLISVKITNPYCEFIENKIFVGCDGIVIYGYENSTAQAYAEECEWDFVPIGEAQPALAGDADLSGKVNILDVITLNRAILGKETLTENQIKAIDFNQNGKPDSEESLMILKYITGLIDIL